MKLKKNYIVLIITLALALGYSVPSKVTVTKGTPTATKTRTPIVTRTQTRTPSPLATLTATATEHAHDTVTPVVTVTRPPATVTVETARPDNDIAPFRGAELCADHDPSKWHGLWNAELGCHYDHEHGTSPYTDEVAAVFPGFDLKELQGGVEIGHTNPSSPIENEYSHHGKHGGMKIDVKRNPNGCAGFEAPTGTTITGVDFAVIQYHTFGNYEVEFNSRTHSTTAMIRQCKSTNPNDFGYAFFNQLQDYGQRTVPYQGLVLQYPDNPAPYDSPRGPYLTIDCDGADARCASTSAQSIWTSKPTGVNANNPFGSKRFNLLFRVRDNYQVIRFEDMVYPFTFKWQCSTDGGLTFTALVGCRFNNSTSSVHEIQGDIPTAWDQTVFDLDRRVGRVTFEGYTTRFGDIALECTEPGTDCHPIKLVSAFVGKYGAQLIDGKINQFSPAAQPERDICFTASGVWINCDLPGAISAGWIGQNN